MINIFNTAHNSDEQLFCLLTHLISFPNFLSFYLLSQSTVYINSMYMFISLKNIERVQLLTIFGLL